MKSNQRAAIGETAPGASINLSLEHNQSVKRKLWLTKITARVALGLVWIYEGLIPKILFVRADEIALVARSGMVWRTAEWTLLTMGLAQTAVGLWLLIGWAERASVTVATAWMSILILLVASGNPGMLTDPYGALIKDLCLIACALTVWTLSPIVPVRS